MMGEFELEGRINGTSLGSGEAGPSEVLSGERKARLLRVQELILQKEQVPGAQF